MSNFVLGVFGKGLSFYLNCRHHGCIFQPWLGKDLYTGQVDLPLAVILHGNWVEGVRHSQTRPAAHVVDLRMLG